MESAFSEWFDSSGFMPHGHCYLWTPALLWQYVLADGLIGVSYYSIPLALLYFARRRKDLQFNWILVLFSAFIFACGTTHFLAVWTIWHPDYWLDASIKVLTAALSVFTAIVLWPLIPMALKVPSPVELQSAVQRLENQVRERALAQTALAKLNETLESRVAERTAELTAINRKLKFEVAAGQQMMAELRLSDSRFRTLIGAISEVIWRADKSGKVTERTPTSMVADSDFIFDPSRQPWSLPVHPDDQAANLEHWEKGMAGTRPFGHEFRLLINGGGCLQMEYLAIPLLNGAETVDEWIGITRDVTERNAAKNKILALNASIRELVVVVQKLASTRDLQSIVDAVKVSARRLVGADGATVVLLEGESVHYVDEDAIGPLWKGQRFPLDACVSGWTISHRSPAVIEDIYRDPRVPVDGYRSTFVKSMAMVPIRTADPIGAIGVYWAQTQVLGDDQLQLITMLADATAIAIENVRQYDTLESRVDQRTTQLLAANQELETFTYSVSHDLKAPLRGIDGYSRMLLEDHAEALQEEPRRFLMNIRKGAQQMGELIEDLLDYSRIERRTLRVGLHDLGGLVEGVVAQYRSEIEDRGVSVKISLPADEILADPSGLTIAIRNLMDNALKFARRDAGPSIEIGGKSERNTYLVWVRDNGIGFDMQFSTRIFDIFQRLNRVEDYPGTGIGLAIVRKAIQRMNGKVWVESSLGQGSTFFLELPQ